MSGAQTAISRPRIVDKSDQSTIQVVLSDEQEADIIHSVTSWQNSLYSIYSLRGELENIDRQYMRERDWTDDQIKSRLANRRGDTSKIQNITIPIIMPQVQSALTYLGNVFVTSYPIFPVVADPANENAALQLETIIQENSQTVGWAQELIKFFRDGLKYNLQAVECEWQQRTNWTVETDTTRVNNAGARKILWNGNVLKRLDLYNSFWDPRVSPSKMHIDGEFVGYTEIYSRVRFKKFCNELYQKAPVSNVERALKSAPIQGAIGASMNSPFGFYIPRINPFPFYNKNAAIDWLNWATNTPMNSGGLNYTNAYSVTKVYARILPRDYNLNVPEKNTPQVWKFIIVNGQVILTAERLTNIHNFIPVFFGQPIDDGLDYQTKSFAQNVSDMQDIATGLYNGHMATMRRLVGDRVLFDPSRINSKDINSTNPAAKIPVRPSAYGKPLQESVYQFPFRGDQTNSLVETSNLVVNMANLINGQNPAQQGQFVKGNKTRHEYEDIMGHGNGQNQMMAISVHYQVLVPLQECLKLNILQYQQQESMFNQNKKVQVQIQPEDLRKAAVQYKVCDGLIPSDKVTGDDLLQVAMQQMGTSPQLAGQYNLGDAFTYLMKTQGLDLSPFQKSPEQTMYEQQMNMWQQTAMEAIKQGVAFNTPMPQPSQQLQQQMQAREQGQLPGGIAAAALQTTQGGSNA